MTARSVIKKRVLIVGFAAATLCSGRALAQQPSAPAGASAPTRTPAPIAPSPRPVTTPVIPASVATSPDYVIGPDDVLGIIFWREQDLSSDVAVRPDGKISLPLLNEVQAAGLTPEQLRANLTQAANRFVEEPAVTVIVKAINSRKVFITGQVSKPGPYSLTSPTTVLQLIAMAGGVAEYAKSDRIVVMRTENGRTVSHKFNYKQVTEGKNLPQNIELKPGDTIVVP